MGSAKGGGSTTVGYRYSMTLQMGIGRGTIDELVQITSGDLRAWPVPDAKKSTTVAPVKLQMVQQSPARFSLPSIGLGIGPVGAHGFNTGERIAFSGAVPTGFTAGTVYYIKSVTLTAFELAATDGGASINAGAPFASILTATTQDVFDRAGAVVIAEGPNGMGCFQKTDGTSELVSGSQINTARFSGRYQIDAPELFGGDKKEGGLKGTLDLYMGEPTQTYAGWIKNLMGGRVPDFRGIVSAVFDGLVCSLNPYPKPWKMRVRRVLAGWDGEVWQPELASIWMRDGMIKAMNPAHIIYECLTNRDWGRGYPREWIKDSSAIEMAQALYDENFGLCLRYNRQSELSEFIGDVLDHVGGYLRVDRTNGQIDMGLMRGDYDPEDIPLFTYNTGLLSVEDADTVSEEDIVNEVIVKWKDPINNEDRQSRIHNLASIQTHDSYNPTTTEYAGIPTSDLSLRLAQRDLKANASALKRYKVVLDRRAWKVQPGSVFRISAPDFGIYNVVLRAGKVSEADGNDRRITVDAVIDVFGLPASSFSAAEDVQWIAPDRTPVPPIYRRAREATWHDLVRRLSPADLQVVSETSGTIAVMAVKPTVMSQGYNIATKTTAETDFVARNSGVLVPFGIIDPGIGPYDTTIEFVGGIDTNAIELGILQVEDEIMALTAYELSDDGSSGTLTVLRGCVDTVPVDHDVATGIFFLSDDGLTDQREYSMTETVEVKMLTYTSTDTLAVETAPIDTVTITARQNRPWPAANVQVNGTLYGNLSAPIVGDLVLSWNHRNRTVVQDQLIDHADPAGTTIEAGATYTVEVYAGAGSTPVRTVTGLTNGPWTYTTAMMATDVVGSNIRLKFWAVRDGYASEFAHDFIVTR